MRPFDLQFGPRPLLGRAWAIGLALVGCVAVLAALHAAYRHEELRRVDDEVQAAASEKLLKESAASSNLTAARRNAEASSAQRARSRRWALALDDLERVAMVGVTPTALDFDATADSVRVEVSFRSYPTLLEYVAGLNASPAALAWSMTGAEAGAAGPATAVLVARPVVSTPSSACDASAAAQPCGTRP